MNILFLTLLNFSSLKESNIYTDLMREFVDRGHHVSVISPTERRNGEATHLITEDGVSILKLRIGNIQKTNILEKGISTVLISPLFTFAIKRFFSDRRFDLIIYSTPPITFVNAIEYLKKRDRAKAYLLLKDIFPQNAVDIGMLSTTGIKGLLYKHFRKQECRLYQVSDWIGCMSKANVRYVIKNNPSLDQSKVEVCPNSIAVLDKSVDKTTRGSVRNKYGIPLNKMVFVYGGNLGAPQGISFMIECLKACRDVKDAFFLIVGDGTEYEKISSFIKEAASSNVKLMRRLPKEDYDVLVGACDIGLIFLDHRFTIPNFPSRLLSYMQAKLPVLAITDPNTDIGEVICDGGFGWWCESDNVENVKTTIEKILSLDLSEMYEAEYHYLINYYNVSCSYSIIERHLGSKNETEKLSNY